MVLCYGHDQEMVFIIILSTATEIIALHFKIMGLKGGQISFKGIEPIGLSFDKNIPQHFMRDVRSELKKKRREQQNTKKKEKEAREFKNKDKIEQLQSELIARGIPIKKGRKV